MVERSMCNSFCLGMSSLTVGNMHIKGLGIDVDLEGWPSTFFCAEHLRL